MWRLIVAPIVGYIVMVIVVILGITVVWFSMGPEFAFDGESVIASLPWTISMLVSGLIAAIVGGFVASLIGGRNFARKAVIALAALVLVMGIVTIIAQMNFERPVLADGRSVADLSFAEAGQYAVSPSWYNYAIVVVGIIGVLIGGNMKKHEPVRK